MKQKALFTKRLNTDKEDRTFETGEFKAAKHARIGTSSADNVNTAESIASNVLMTSGYSFPSGVNKCIGTCQDVKNQAIIYCIWNSSNNHRIIRYNPTTQVVENILPTTWNVSVLNWQYVRGSRGDTKRLWNMRIVETGDDQIMFFTDGFNNPRRISLNLKNQRGSTYTLTEDDISTARKPPLEVTTRYIVDTTRSTNFIRNKFFQFRARYVWENGELSSWSPYSTLTIPPSNGTDYRAIAVGFNSGPKGVVKVELAVRQGNGISSTGTVNTELYIFDTWEKLSTADNTNQEIVFYNSEVLRAVPRTTSDTNFYQVPQKAGCQEIVESNQVIYGDITEGYNNLNLTPEQLPTFGVTYDQTGIVSFNIGRSGDNYTITISNDYVPNPNQQVTITINGVDYSYISTAATAANYVAEIVAFLKSIGYTATSSSGVITTNAIFQSISSYTYDWLQTTNLTSVNDSSNLGIPTGTSKVKLTFTNINYNGIEFTLNTDFKITGNVFGILNFDLTLEVISTTTLFSRTIGIIDVATGDFITSSVIDITSLVQTFNYTASIEANSLVGKTIAIAIQQTNAISVTIATRSLLIKLQTPHYFRQGFKSGATHKFGIVYYDEFLRQTGVQAINSVYVKAPPERSYPYPWGVGGSIYDGYIPQISWSITHRPPLMAKYYKWVYNGSNINKFCQFVANVKDPTAGTNVGFNYVTITTQSLALYPFIFKDINVGDTIRIMLGRGYNLISTTGAPYIESTILAVSATELQVDTSNGQFNTKNLDGALVEIFTTNQTEFFFEFAPIYEIGNPNTITAFHKGPTQNQTSNLSQPALGSFLGTTYFYINNQFLRNRDDNTGYPNTRAFCENANIDNNSDSSFWNKGRIQIETPLQTQQRISWMLRWGGKLYQDTEINNMSSFEAGQYRILSAKWGATVGLREIGYTLKIIQEVNYSTAFIGRRELQESSGATQQVLITDSLIGTINESESGYGTKYPGSILVFGRNMYFYDTTKGEVIRESGNAPFPISNYGMVRYFRDTANLITSDNYEIITGFNKPEESLYMTWFTEEITTQVTYFAANVTLVSGTTITAVILSPSIAFEIGDIVKIVQGSSFFVGRITAIDLGLSTYTITLLGGTATVNPINSIYILTDDNETISFFEPSRQNQEPGWVSNHEFTKTVSSEVVPIEMYGYIGQIFTAALNANVYEFNDTNTYLNLFGEDKDFTIKSVFNLEPDASKVFLAHAVHSNLSADKTTFVIPANQQTPNGMKSILVEGNYKLREGAFYADIKKDGYSKGVSSENTAQFITGLINGRPMRGRVIEVEILYRGNAIFVLFSHEVEIQYSPLS
jgi:hypothetical protein